MITWFSFSEEDGGDTADSLDIKPPQAVIRHRKSGSSHRREKHNERRDRREEKERKSRHHDRGEDRHRDKHRHRRHGMDPMDRSERSEGSKRERERMERLERMESHPRDRESRHDRKERSTGDRVLEDLRERYFFSFFFFKFVHRIPLFLYNGHSFFSYNFL